jgi:hypothetical protein
MFYHLHISGIVMTVFSFYYSQDNCPDLESEGPASLILKVHVSEPVPCTMHYPYPKSKKVKLSRYRHYGAKGESIAPAYY